MKKLINNINIVLLIAVVLTVNPLYSQMPDWNTVVDKDGNRYYVDKNGRIWTSGKPEFDYKPVSLSGLDFYINHGIELTRGHFKIEGLTILKSIMAMPDRNQRVHEARIRASKEINRLIKLEGSRYKRLNELASVMLIRDNGLITIINDKMRYTVKFSFSVRVIRTKNRRKPHYSYHGMLIGLKNHDIISGSKKSNGGYDALVSIDSERFQSKINSLKEFEINWRNNLGSENFERNLLEKGEDRSFYTFISRHPPRYYGFDGFFIKGRVGYFIRIISSKNTFEKNREGLLKIIKGFMI